MKRLLRKVKMLVRQTKSGRWNAYCPFHKYGIINADKGAVLRWVLQHDAKFHILWPIGVETGESLGDKIN